MYLEGACIHRGRDEPAAQEAIEIWPAEPAAPDTNEGWEARGLCHSNARQVQTSFLRADVRGP